MAEETKKLEFFSDVRDKFLLIIGGIISLSTVIPAFLNKTSEIFGWEKVSIGYYVFVAIYFILPYVFYLLYCSIHDYVGYLVLLPDKKTEYLNRRKTVKTIIDIVIPIAILAYLIFPLWWFSFGISIVLIGIGIICFVWFVYQYFNDININGISKEVLIVGCVVILVFGMFFFNMVGQGWDKGLFKYSNAGQYDAFDAYEARNELDNDFKDLLDSIKKESDRYQARADLISPKEVRADSKTAVYEGYYFKEIYKIMIKIDTTKAISKENISESIGKLKVFAGQMLCYQEYLVRTKKTSHFYEANSINVFSHSLVDYGSAIQKAKVKAIAKQWAELLKVLQYKSMSWFFLLIMLGLCLWLKMQKKMQDVSNEVVGFEAEENESNQIRISASIEVRKKDIDVISDNLSQVKSLVFLLFVLIIPWFRSIDSKDIELDKPFLNFSLNNLANGGGATGGDVSKSDSKTENNGDKTINFIDNGTKFKLNDSLLIAIDTNVKVSTKLIKEQAARTIGSAEDRSTFEENK